MDLRQQVGAFLTRGDAAGAARLLEEMWRTQGGTASAGYVVSSFDRIREKLALRPCRWAVVRSFTVEPLVAVLKAGAYAAGVALDVHLGEFNAWTQELLDPESALYRFQPEIVVLAVQTRDLPVDSALDRLAGCVAAFRRHSDAALIVHTLEQPAMPAAGLLDAQDPDGEAEAVRRVNRGLAEVAKQHRGVYLLDYDALVARHGRNHWGDERKWLTVRLPVASANLPYLAAEWLRFLHPLTGKVAKCVAVDLDNTLWGGVIGEDGMNGIQLGPEYPGAAFQQVQRALLDLKKRGILLAVCSKNNPADALEALSGHAGMILRPEDFAATRINWNSKAQSLREIAAELNIGLDSVAFLDDNPVERQHVREQAPEAIVIDLPQDAMAFARTIRECPWFERLTLSQEDRQRSELYAAQRERAELERTVTSREDFYRSLEQICEIADVNPATLSRVAQLTQKTNQFNLTTRRYTEQQIAALREQAGWRVWSMHVKDRYADNGLVAVAITKTEGGTCEIDTFLMSCRVIGRTVETALLASIAEHAREEGAAILRGQFVPTKKNAPAADFYRDHGFQNGEDGMWTLDLRDRAIEMPAWITTVR